MTRYLTLAAFVATVPAANWLIGNVGTTCVPNGPCLLPVGFGLSAGGRPAVARMGVKGRLLGAVAMPAAMPGAGLEPMNEARLGAWLGPWPGARLSTLGAWLPQSDAALPGPGARMRCIWRRRFLRARYLAPP